MFESRYKNMMKRCVLSDDEKEKSFERILEKTVNSESRPKKSHKKIIISAVSLAACVAMFGGITVYAYNENWLKPIFGIEDSENDFAMVDKYNGIVTNMSYDIDGYDAELIYSCGNDKVISAVVKLTPIQQEESDAMLSSGYGEVSNDYDEYCKIIPNDDNSYYMYASYYTSQTTLTKGSVSSKINVNCDAEENEPSSKKIGSVTFDYDISTAENCPVFYNENDLSRFKTVSLTPFYVMIDSRFTAYQNQRTGCYDNVEFTLNFEDGTQKDLTARLSSMAASSTGSGYAFNYIGFYDYFSEDDIIDCSKVTSVQIGDDTFKPVKNPENETESVSEASTETTVTSETESESTSVSETVSETELTQESISESEITEINS